MNKATFFRFFCFKNAITRKQKSNESCKHSLSNQKKNLHRTHKYQIRTPIVFKNVFFKVRFFLVSFILKLKDRYISKFGFFLETAKSNRFKIADISISFLKEIEIMISNLKFWLFFMRNSLDSV